MAAFKEMDPALIQKALEGHEDVLTGEAKKEEMFFKHSSCPVCGSNELLPFVDANFPFINGVLLSKKLLRCLSCQSEFDPYSRVVAKATVSLD